RPQGKYDWASYSPANPDWAVYLDWRYPTSWTANAGALAQELEDAGFAVENAQDLAAWMRQAIQGGDAANTVAVFAQDIAPDTVADQESSSALVRQYLNAGGNVLWLGDIPFYYQGHANQPREATQWSQFGEQAILGVSAAAQMMPVTNSSTAATGAGQGVGLQTQGNVAEALASVRPLAAGQVGCGVVPLALDGAGDLSGWRLPFSPNMWSSLACTDPMGLGQALANDSPGFVRIYDIGLDGASGSEDADVLAVAGQIAGWYLGQAVSVNWQNPYSGPVFDQGPAGGGVWRRTDWPDANARWIWTFPLAGANAPAGWPVRFARLFTLDQLTTVSFHVAVDDQVLHLWVDGVDETPQGGCAWNRDCTVSMALGQGKHLLVAEAVNAAGSGRFRNPAGFLLTAEDASGNVLFSTAADGSWTSWTAPNPDWVVYSDTNYPAAYGLNAAALAGYLAKAGFTVEDAPGLGAWMRQEIQSGKAPQSVAVLPQGVAPDTVADQESSSALVRQYLNAGGNVLWIGDVPFYYQGHRGWSTTWGNQGLQAILGVGDDARHWDRSVVPQVTTAGAGYGIGLSPYGMQWANEPSTRPMPTYQTPTADGMNCQLENLATNPNGGSSYWRVGYWPN
ncbi:MAG: hypothetical protein IMW98_09650, partial [Firmicutes bacterium]|nr:hypothetical protein [Bacillota bacterium]